MKYSIQRTSQFKRDLKRAVRRGCSVDLLKEIVILLSDGKALPEKNKDHPLTGNWVGFRECHITPDWLLVYRIYDDILMLSLVRTGSHSDLDF